MDLEKIATSAVVSEISKTDVLSGFISEGDKEPCWDGNIYIHEDSRKTKKNLKRVPTQIKGKAVRIDKTEDSIKYSISHDDLYAYMIDGGTLFFVVYIDKDSGDVLQIYYSQLIQLKIMGIINQKNKTYSVLFNKFPKDNKEKVEIVYDTFANAQRQKSYAGKKMPTIDELNSKGLLDSVSIHITAVGKEISPRTIPRIMEGKPVTIYANIKGNPIGIPVEHYQRINNVTTYQEFNKRIFVNGIEFFDRYRIIYNSSEVKTVIGNCLTLTSPYLSEDKMDPVPVTLNIIIKGSLNEQIRGLTFILEIAKYEGFEIETVHIPVELARQVGDEKIRELKERLNILKYIQLVLDNMHVRKDLILDDYDEEDEKNLNLLIGAIGEKKPVKNLPEESNIVHTLKVANLLLGVCYVMHADGFYYMHDYFGTHIEAKFEANGNTIRTSQYAPLVSSDFIEFDNVYTPIILEDFKMLPVSSEIINHANLLMLEMIKAYDECKGKELLDSAEQMNNWIMEYPDYIEKQICVINQYQIIARKRELSFSEKVELLSITENSDNKEYKVGALILLGELEQANKILSTFDESDFNAFCSYPIYALTKHPLEN